MPMREFSRDRQWLMPPSLGELLRDDHPARFVAAFVDELDFDQVGVKYVVADEGAPAYNPYLLLGCWLYGFMSRVRSSRKIEQACQENVAFMWLSDMQTPDHTTLWRFYKTNRSCMRKLLKRTVELAIEVELVDFAIHAVDGSKIAAVAKDGLVKRAKVEALLEKVNVEIAAMEEGNEREEGEGSRQRLPQALSKKKELRERIRGALVKLESLDGVGKEESEGQGSRRKKKGKEAEVSVSDPDAALMKGRGKYVAGYNGQVVVDGKAQIIVGADVIDSASDVGQLIPMLKEVKDIAGGLAEVTVSDSGYYSGENLEEVAREETEIVMTDPQMKRKEDSPETWRYHKEHFVYDKATDTFRCPEGGLVTFSHTTPSRRGKSGEGEREVRVYRGRECKSCLGFGKGGCTEDQKGRAIGIYGYEERMSEHRKKMAGEEARQLMKRRSVIVEPVFGVIREQMGLVRFLVRGLEKVRAEWQLTCTAYNLRKIWKLWWSKRAVVSPEQLSVG